MRVTALGAALILLTGCASFVQTARPTHIGHTGFIAAQTADVITTQYALDAGLTEGNPVINFALGDRPPLAGMVAWKAALWMGFRQIESGWEARLDRDLRWYERLLLWGPGIVLGVLAAKINRDNVR